jgi:hypothetical protein
MGKPGFILAGMATFLNLLPFWSGHANAEPGPVQVFQEFGLLGAWSPDCRREPSPDNPRVIWRVVNGTIVHTVTLDGRNLALVDTVGSARIVGEGLIRFTSIRHDRVALTVTLRMREGRIRTVRSEGPDGQVYYDHERELATGKPSISDEPCAMVISEGNHQVLLP